LWPMQVEKYLEEHAEGGDDDDGDYGEGEAVLGCLQCHALSVHDQAVGDMKQVLSLHMHCTQDKTRQVLKGADQASSGR